MSDELYIPEETRKALKAYSDAERKRQDNPVIQDLITWKSMAQHILKNELIKRGYMLQNGKAK
jgi:hypothetical protein